jgi:hypothetical protein
MAQVRFSAGSNMGNHKSPLCVRFAILVSRSIVAAFVLLIPGWVCDAQAAGGREALVIGNGAYEHAPALANPRADATAIAQALEAVGFHVMLRTDLKRQEMGAAFRDFGDRADHADIALVYYAGHGIQLARGNNSENYLIPTDARLLDVRDVDDEALSLDRALERLDGAHARVVILDACRDNPLANQMHGLNGTRSVSRGLARVDATSRGTLLVFSTEPGSVALDSGTGANSPFATALLHNIGKPGLEVRLMLTRVRAEVYQETDGHQTPWSNDGLFDEMFLVPALPSAPAAASPAAAPAPAAPDEARLDAEFWDQVKGSTDPSDVNAYLRRFPNGLFAALAHNLIDRLTERGHAAPPPASMPTRPPEVASVNPVAPAPPAIVARPSPPSAPSVATSRPTSPPVSRPATPAPMPPRQQAEIAPRPPAAAAPAPSAGSISCLLPSGATTQAPRTRCRDMLGIAMP